MAQASPKQKGLSFEPEYLEDRGVKFAFAGGLYVPAPGESEWIEKEQKLTELHDKIREKHEEFKRTLAKKDSLRVKMNPFTVLKMRAK